MSLDQNGFEILHNIFTENELFAIKAELSTQTLPHLTAGIRNADKKFPSINSLVSSSKLLNIAKRYLHGSPAIVRVILFNKTANNNWLVSWHQDKTICISERKEIVGWGPWTLKDGTQHVQPPLEVLNQIVTLRIHLDDSTIKTGCLRVIPKSHLWGILSSAQIQAIASSAEAIDCEGEMGSILVMKPHLLHASSKAIKPSQRRVIHVEYSSYTLPENLTWA